MPQYEVTVTRTLTLQALIEVRAQHEDDAAAKAYALATHHDLAWNINDTLSWEHNRDAVTVENIEEIAAGLPCHMPPPNPPQVPGRRVPSVG